VADSLIPLLQGRISLRIANPQSDAPVTFEPAAPSPNAAP
jgi:hypothetical protein